MCPGLRRLDASDESDESMNPRSPSKRRMRLSLQNDSIESNPWCSILSGFSKHVRSH